MEFVGVLGKSTGSLLKQLSERYTDADIKCFVNHEGIRDYQLIRARTQALENGFEVFITDVDTMSVTNIKYDILIFACECENDIKSALNMVKTGGYIIVNADDCHDLLESVSDIKIITCGVSRKAMITFSGIKENKVGKETIQCCLQEKIITLSKRYIDPQEFAVNVVGVDYPLSEVLMVITTAIIADIEETVTSVKLFSKD